jgi:hypothetical protein
VRQRVRDLINTGYVVYIALDQLEETYRNINYDEKLVHEFVEIVRGKLSAMVEKRYALGVSIVEPVWGDIIAKLPSMRGIESIRLTNLDPEKTEVFITKYLEKARDPEILRKYDIEK